MKLSAPKNITFYVAVALVVIALIGYFIAAMTPFAPWILLIGFIVLAAGVLFEGL